ncbi:MAG: hypothetical protein ACXVB9_03680 [Bdellovibrionota bacterium]
MKIAVIGNGGGGKTTLSRRLAARHDLPLTHVDSIQFLPGLKVRPQDETRRELNRIAEGDRWLIDGFGPLDVMERRFELASRIIFVDFPLWRHYWWATKRQVKSRRHPRPELPPGCEEGTLTHTWQLYRVLWRVHTVIRPQLREIFSRTEISSKVLLIKTPLEWNAALEI